MGTDLLESGYSALREDADERVEEAVEEMLNELRIKLSKLAKEEG